MSYAIGVSGMPGSVVRDAGSRRRAGGHCRRYFVLGTSGALTYVRASDLRRGGAQERHRLRQPRRYPGETAGSMTADMLPFDSGMAGSAP